jgi:RNA polymerase sigma factor (sigma-70 family)
VRLTLVPADRDLASYASLGDAALGALVAERDGLALEALYDRYGTACYSLARRIAVDLQLAQDVVQEVFLTLWHNAGRFDGERGSLSTYLLSITHHKAVDAVRKEERQRSRRAPAEVLELTDSGQDVAEETWTELRRSKVRGALAELPQPQRETLVLAYFGGYTQQEIARLTDTPLGTVKTRTLAALRRLKTSLAGYDENGTGGGTS